MEARNKLREKSMKKERESKEFQCVMQYFEARREDVEELPLLTAEQ